MQARAEETENAHLHRWAWERIRPGGGWEPPSEIELGVSAHTCRHPTPTRGTGHGPADFTPPDILVRGGAVIAVADVGKAGSGTRATHLVTLSRAAIAPSTSSLRFAESTAVTGQSTGNDVASILGGSFGFGGLDVGSAAPPGSSGGAAAGDLAAVAGPVPGGRARPRMAAASVIVPQ
jgi:hypothetical protein